MTLKYILTTFLVMYSACVMAESHWDFAREVRDKQVSSLQSLKQAMQQSQRDAQYKNGAFNPIYIFVSFSMPEKSIEAYMRDAKKMNGRVVIRGLVNNSFQQTFQKISMLVQNSGGTGVELNPLWFDKFSIKQVPAIVVLPPDAACDGKERCDVAVDFDLIKGDISLYEALRQIKHKGIAHQTAEEVLRG